MLEERLSKYLHDYKILGAEEARELELLVSKYPWFNGGHILLAKAHKNQNRYSFRNLLKKASLHAGDRSELFEVMHDRWLPLEQYLQDEQGLSREVPILPVREIAKETEPEEIADASVIPETHSPGDREEFSIPEISDTIHHETLDDAHTGEDVLTEPQVHEDPTDEPVIQNPPIEEHFETVEHERFVPEETVEQTGEIETPEEQEADEQLTVHSKFDEDAEAEISTTSEIDNPNNDDPIPAPESTRTDLEEVIKYDPIEALQPLIGRTDIDSGIGSDPPVRITPLYDPERELLKLIDSEKPGKKKPTGPEVDPEPHDFAFWLDHLSDAREEDTSETEHAEADEDPSSHSEQADAADLLEKFIKKRPSIRRMEREFFSPEKQSQRSIEDNSDIVSESLAKLYLKQGFPEKAIEVFNKLRLQNPQKDAYFARLIQELKP